MKKRETIKLLIGLLVIVALIALSTASCTGAPAETPTIAPTSTPTAIPTGTQSTGGTLLEGTVTSVAGSQFVVRNDRGQEIMLQMRTGTVFEGGRIGDIQPGAIVQVTYDPATLTANKIGLKAAAPVATATPTVTPAAVSFVASLTGTEEVPAVNSTAEAQAVFNLNVNGKELGYRVTVSSIQNITASHLHLAPRGQNGPPVVWLFPPVNPTRIPGLFNGVLAEGRIREENFVGPLQNQTFSALIDKIMAGEIYVNIHTDAFPNGEIRGQVSPRFPQAGNTTSPMEFDAVVVQVSGANVVVRKPDSTQLTIAMDNMTWVQLVNGQKGTLSDLKPDTKVEVYIFPGSLTAEKIELRDALNSASGKVEGNIVSIVADTISISTGAGNPVIIEYGGSTRIDRVDGSVGTRADLAVGKRVEAYYNSATRFAFRIELK